MDSSLDIVWVIFCAILVSTMQAGFCCLESGLVRAKNSINVAIKNLVDFCIASLVFSLVGFSLMFGETLGGIIGLRLPGIESWAARDYTFFLFELTFCGTATTIVSGAVAERMSFWGYFLTALTVATLIYPVTGHWVWGGLWFDLPQGWLARLEFHDFAGATVVHSVGGWMALAAILVIGPRQGRFSPRPHRIDGHNLPTAVLGVFLLWFGWFGFNGGSVLAFSDQVPRILVNTAEGGAAGGVTALLLTWWLHRRPQVSVIMNGVVGGLVSVTAGCDVLLPWSAICVGCIGGGLCTLSNRWLSRCHIDDAVGVVPAHLVCGVWGTLAVGIFYDLSAATLMPNLAHRLPIQLLGVTAVAAYAFSVSYGILRAINRFCPLRVTPQQEYIGLNISEHGATTATQQLIASMNEHSLQGKFTEPVTVEPGTDVAPIADYYNQVLKKMSLVQSELKMSQGQLLRILNSPAFPVVISRSDSGVIVFVNDRAAELLGFRAADASYYRETDLWCDRRDRDRFFVQLARHQRVSSYEAKLCKVDKTPFWSLISGLEIAYEEQRCILLSFSDITTQIEREQGFKILANTDSLTGLYNRRAFLAEAEQLMVLSMQQHWSLELMMIDIDRFKEVNDRYGHAQGDRVIKAIADACVSLLQKLDIAARLGGEEFVILLCPTSPQIGRTAAEELRRKVRRMALFGCSEQKQVTVSIGVTSIRPGESIDAALGRADQALYRAKAGGRDRVEIY